MVYSKVLFDQTENTFKLVNLQFLRHRRPYLPENWKFCQTHSRKILTISDIYLSGQDAFDDFSKYGYWLWL